MFKYHVDEFFNSNVNQLNTKLNTYNVVNGSI
jgi:hypothetical protein